VGLEAKQCIVCLFKMGVFLTRLLRVHHMITGTSTWLITLQEPADHQVGLWSPWVQLLAALQQRCCRHAGYSCCCPRPQLTTGDHEQRLWQCGDQLVGLDVKVHLIT
jgi:hypothetical protein